MTTLTRAVVPVVVQQHAEEAAMLRHIRSVLVAAPHVRLLQLRRLDDRLAAHLDGLAVAGDFGTRLAWTALERPGCGEVFTVAVRAIEEHDAAGLDRLLSLAEAVPQGPAGLISAFGWVTGTLLRGITLPLLDSPQAFRRRVGIAACALHGVDAGHRLTVAAKDDDAPLRAQALRAMARSGQALHRPSCLAALADPDPRCRWEAARAAALLGDGAAALSVLRQVATTPGPAQAHALVLTCRLQAPADNQRLLQGLAAAASPSRLLIQGMGAAGDPQGVPWLIQQMRDLKWTRLAGEAFSTLTGLDLAQLDLEQKPPDNTLSGPTEAADDDNVALDEDESLPWPDADKISAWWQAHSAQWMPGVRYFMGQPPSAAHAQQVLKTGFQRQRRAAAETWCLQQPGTPLFNTEAPAWRQARQLQTLGGP